MVIRKTLVDPRGASSVRRAEDGGSHSTRAPGPAQFASDDGTPARAHPGRGREEGRRRRTVSRRGGRREDGGREKRLGRRRVGGGKETTRGKRKTQPTSGTTTSGALSRRPRGSRDEEKKDPSSKNKMTTKRAKTTKRRRRRRWMRDAVPNRLYLRVWTTTESLSTENCRESRAIAHRLAPPRLLAYLLTRIYPRPRQSTAMWSLPPRPRRRPLPF